MSATSDRHRAQKRRKLDDERLPNSRQRLALMRESPIRALPVLRMPLTPEEIEVDGSRVQNVRLLDSCSYKYRSKRQSLATIPTDVGAAILMFIDLVEAASVAPTAKCLQRWITHSATLPRVASLGLLGRNPKAKVGLVKAYPRAIQSVLLTKPGDLKFSWIKGSCENNLALQLDLSASIAYSESTQKCRNIEILRANGGSDIDMGDHRKLRALRLSTNLQSRRTKKCVQHSQVEHVEVPHRFSFLFLAPAKATAFFPNLRYLKLTTSSSYAPMMVLLAYLPESLEVLIFNAIEFASSNINECNRQILDLADRLTERCPNLHTWPLGLIPRRYMFSLQSGPRRRLDDLIQTSIYRQPQSCEPLRMKLKHILRGSFGYQHFNTGAEKFALLQAAAFHSTNGVINDGMCEHDFRLLVSSEQSSLCMTLEFAEVSLNERAWLSMWCHCPNLRVLSIGAWVHCFGDADALSTMMNIGCSLPRLEVLEVTLLDCWCSPLRLRHRLPSFPRLRELTLISQRKCLSVETMRSIGEMFVEPVRQTLRFFTIVGPFMCFQGVHTLMRYPLCLSMLRILPTVREHLVFPRVNSTRPSDDHGQHGFRQPGALYDHKRMPLAMHDLPSSTALTKTFPLRRFFSKLVAEQGKPLASKPCYVLKPSAFGFQHREWRLANFVLGPDPASSRFREASSRHFMTVVNNQAVADSHFRRRRFLSLPFEPHPKRVFRLSTP